MNVFSKKNLITAGITLMFLFFGLLGGITHADPPDAIPHNNPNAPKDIMNLLQGQESETGILGQSFSTAKTHPTQIIGSLIFVVLGFLGTLMIILMLYSGFLWMTAAGEDKKVKLAQDHLRNAVIGSIIILSAWTIATFVLNRISQAVTQ